MPKKKNPDHDDAHPDTKFYGTGPMLASMREMDAIDPNRLWRAQGRTGWVSTDVEDIFLARREAILAAAKERGIPYTLSDVFAEDLDLLEAKLNPFPREPRKPGRREEEVTEYFLQVHLQRIVDMVETSPVTVFREGSPLLVMLSPEDYAALTAGRPVTSTPDPIDRPAAIPGFGKEFLGDVPASGLTLTPQESEAEFGLTEEQS